MKTSSRFSRWVTLVALVPLLLSPAAAPAPAPQPPAPAPGPAGIESLPPAAQAAVSAALGEEDAAYHFRPVAARSAGPGWQATQARQGVTAQLTGEGALITSGAAQLNLSLTSYGWGRALRPAEKAAPTARANRVEYARGEVTEWYVNGPVGLEHGFTIAEPNPAASGTQLTLTLALRGDFGATVDPDGAGLTLAAAGGAVALRYRGLEAVDAAGKELPARFELLAAQQGGRAVAIRVETAGARYPITVDPWIQNARLTASDGAEGDEFGCSVAVSGDVVVVGAGLADTGTGAAYVFVKPGDGWGSMTQSAMLTASDGAASDMLGSSAAIQGDVVFVGAVRTDSSKGAAYVFVQPNGGWSDMTETRILTASDGGEDDQFGFSTAASGSTVVVGANGVDADTGAVYVFDSNTKLFLPFVIR